MNYIAEGGGHVDRRGLWSDCVIVQVLLQIPDIFVHAVHQLVVNLLVLGLESSLLRDYGFFGLADLYPVLGAGQLRLRNPCLNVGQLFEHLLIEGGLWLRHRRAGDMREGEENLLTALEGLGDLGVLGFESFLQLNEMFDVLVRSLGTIALVVQQFEQHEVGKQLFGGRLGRAVRPIVISSMLMTVFVVLPVHRKFEFELLKHLAGGADI